MNLTPEQQKEFAKFPAALRALVEAELAAGNAILELGHCHPAPPVGACVKLANKVSTRPRAPGEGLKFYDRNSSLYSGEFTDAERLFFVLEPPNPPPPEPDMDAICKAHEPKPDALTVLAKRKPALASAAGQRGPSASAQPKKSRVSNAESRREGAVDSVTVQASLVAETATGWTRVLNFRDKRPPHLVQFALERELMVLFSAAMDGRQLRMTATAHVHGARYDFALCFVAALKSDNYFALRTEASWADAAATNHEYFRKTSESRFQSWTRDLTGATPPAPKEGVGERYQQLCEATLQAQKQLDSVGAVQQAIVAGLKSGGTFSTSHKEGGTNIGWRNGRFVRSDYGEYPDRKEFTDEAEFLKMLRRFCHCDVTRHAGTKPLPEFDEWKLILRGLDSA